MKSITFMLLILFYSNCIAQNPPSIQLSTTKLIQGVANYKDTIKISIDGDFLDDSKLLDKNIVTDKNGEFIFKYKNELDKSVKSVIIWKVDKKGDTSEHIIIPVLSNSEMIDILDEKKVYPFFKKSVRGNVHSYKATILNTNFSIPMARFNFTNGEEGKKGNILLFNSIGAGFGYSLGQLTEITDDSGKVLNQSFKNTFGLHLGVLFSAGTGENNENVFAPILNASILDFQVGLGYELGTVTNSQKRTFVTISYSIPLYKLTNTSFYILKSDNKENNTFSIGNF